MKELTIKEKQLLLKDLCARLPYGVKCKIALYKTAFNVLGIVEDKVNLDSPVYDEGDDWWEITEIKPYLRPMSSMTEEEKEDILQSLNIHGDIDNEGNLLLGVECNIITLKVCKKYLGELNKRMFDVCRMIEKGLALEAPEGMYNLKEK